MRLKAAIFSVILASQFVSMAQNSVEFNRIKLQQSGNDTAKVNALNFFGKYHINVDIDSAFFYARKAEALATKLNYQRGLAMSHLTLGIAECELGNFPEALDLILKANSEAEKIKDYHLLAGVKLNLGNFYIKTKDIDKAIETYQSGIKICEQHNIIYTQASLYTSIGMGLRIKGELDSALIYYDKVLEIHQNVLHDSTVIAAIYNNIASAYHAKKDIQTAENYLLKALEINQLTGNQRYELMCLSNLAGMVGQNPGGDLEKSLEYFDRSIEMAKAMKSKQALQSIYEDLSIIYYEHKKFQDACDNLLLSMQYKDSILGEDKQQQILAISEEFKTKQFQDSLRIKEQELELSQSNEEAANLRASQSTWQLIGVVVLLVGILTVLFFVYRHFKTQKKINALLQEKNDEIYEQKIQIEEKNSELTDSINYARRIQRALLPSAGYLSKTLGDHFLIFKPKDIVSGDFYWVKQDAKKHYFAVADCTGHGVPGAMVSMLGFETIERVASSEISDAADFVNRVNESLVTSLTARGDEGNTKDQMVKDGMDLSLCIVTDKQKLSYCGANNECYIIRKNDLEFPLEHDMLKINRGENYSVIELKPTKRPVGVSDSANDFKAVELQLLRGDMFYLFSDGYADQFGGERGKKMKTSSFRETLLKGAHLSMKEQHQYLEEFLVAWQSNFDQLDDITVLGVKIE